MKRSEKSRKASSIDAEKRKQAEFDLGKKQPAQTWSARMPAYTYTAACPDPELREPPKAVIDRRCAGEESGKSG